MTEPTTPTLDPVEGRLRRTLAARAEDMSPGDAADDLPDPAADRREASLRYRRRNRPLVAAAVVLVVGLATAGVALVARNGGDDAERLATAGGQTQAEAPVAAITAPRALVVALQHERLLATARMVGLEDAIRMPVTDTEMARSETDAAVASFETFVAGSPSGGAYRPGLDALAALGELRREIDAFTGPRNLDSTDTALETFGRYAAIAGGLIDSQKAFVDTIDDPIVRAGGVAYGHGLQLDEQIAHMGVVGLFVAISPGSDTVAELGRLHTAVQNGLDALLAETAGTPYAEPAATVVGEIADVGLLDATGAALEGQTDISAVLTATELSGEEAWPAFLDQVEEILGES